jgi:hypothetical protein
MWTTGYARLASLRTNSKALAAKSSILNEAINREEMGFSGNRTIITTARKRMMIDFLSQNNNITATIRWRSPRVPAVHFYSMEGKYFRAARRKTPRSGEETLARLQSQRGIHLARFF